MEAYRGFKKVVPSIAEEKTLCKEFEEASGYVCYRVVQAAKDTSGEEIIKGMPSRWAGAFLLFKAGSVSLTWSGV